MSDASALIDREAEVVERARREVAERGSATSGRRRGNGVLTVHWLALVNAANGLFVAGTIVAPWLRAHGQDWPATALYTFYRLQCLQRPSHSFFVFGQKMGMEQRMMAIYAGGLFAGLVFARLRRRLRPLSNVLLIVLSLPMLLDVASQMAGLRDGTWQWRVATGLLFAFAGAWWALPRIDRVTPTLATSAT